MLTCRVEAVSVVCLLQTVEAAALTGTLFHDEVEIDFVRGAPCAARGKGSQGLAVLLDLFVLDRGEVRFQQREVSGEAMGDNFAIQMEGCRLADEWSRLRRSVFAVATAGQVPAALEQQLDGVRDLEQALVASGLWWSEVADEVIEAAQSGGLSLEPVVTEPADPEPGDPEGAVSFDDLLSTGRRALKERDFPEAIRAFEQALTLRPDSAVVAQNLRRTIAVRNRWRAE
ncbi:MAG: DUF4388 domain-containing protein [Myxococcales bacterium]|nr:DUF4388 domain-containing protein [Myxococcales bacterium]